MTPRRRQRRMVSEVSLKFTFGKDRGERKRMMGRFRHLRRWPGYPHTPLETRLPTPGERLTARKREHVEELKRLRGRETAKEGE